MSLEDVIAATTSRPAAAIRKGGRFGNLEPGVRADIAVLRVVDGEFPFEDASGNVRVGRERIIPVATLLGGKLVFFGDSNLIR